MKSALKIYFVQEPQIMSVFHILKKYTDALFYFQQSVVITLVYVSYVDYDKCLL